MNTSLRFIPQSLLAGLMAFSPIVLAGPSIDDLLADFDESTPGVLIGVVRGGELTETGAAAAIALYDKLGQRESVLHFDIPVSD